MRPESVSRDERDRPCAAPAARATNALEERVGDRLDDDEALGRDAALAAVHEPRVAAQRRAARVQVGVGEHDERVAAAELEHRLLERARRPAPRRRGRPASLPVSVTAATRGSAMSRRHRVGRRPAASGTAPAGSPRRATRSSMASAQPGTFEACLSTPPLPAISAGAAKRNTCQKGKFQGMIASTRPSGSKRDVAPARVGRDRLAAPGSAAACSA